MTDDEIGRELVKPLDASRVKPAAQFGPKGDYIEGWWAISEANRIFGWDGWTRETVEVRCVAERERKIGQAQKDGWGVTYTAKVRIVVGRATVREGTGAGSGIDVDLGLAHESAIKEAETDAMKRALMTFGNPFGLALYDKKRENVGEPEKLSQRAAPIPPRDQHNATVAPIDKMIAEMDAAPSMDALAAVWSKYPEQQKAPGAIKAKDRNKARLTAREMVTTGNLGG